MSKQPSTVLHRDNNNDDDDDDGDDDDDDDDDKCYFSLDTEWQTEAIYAMSPDCIFVEGTVIKPGRNQFGLICAVLAASRCAEWVSRHWF